MGIFSLKAKAADVSIAVPDGEYENLIDSSTVTVSGGMLHCGGKPIIFRAE